MYVILTVDLNHASDSKKRDKFNDELKSKKWRKFPNITTTWWAGFQSGTSAAGAIAATKSDVTEAAIAAGVASWDAVCHAGPEKPCTF